MAHKRAFSKTIIDTDAFQDMPQTAQLLYFYLNMSADDDGFVGNPKRIMRSGGFAEDDFKILLAKRFLLLFESGVVVIKHWLIHNTIRRDRYQETTYIQEKKMLQIKENKAYTNSWQPFGNHLATQNKIKENKIKENKISMCRFAPPTPKEVKDYCLERKNSVDPEKWYDFYLAKGWMIGKNKMKDWKAAVRTWEKEKEINQRKISKL